MIRWLRSRATYANVMASAAVFIALGGTSYAAITLPRNSVGERQVKPRAVGSGKLKTGAVRSRAIRDGAIKVQDIARTTRQALTGAQGPPGAPGAPAVALRASVSSTGALRAGNASSTDSPGVGQVSVHFPRALAGCVPVATLAKHDGPIADPGPGHIVVSMGEDRVLVDTYAAGGTLTYLPFNLIVSC